MPTHRHQRRLLSLARHVAAAGTPAAAASSSPFKIVLLAGSGGRIDRLEAALRESYPDVSVAVADGEVEAVRELADADAAYGELSPAMLAAAPRLRWVQCHMAAPPEEYFFPELKARSDVVVTNMRGIYDEELSVHMITLLLAVNRQLGDYRDQQRSRKYHPITFNRGDYHEELDAADQRVDVGSATALLVGVGNAGGETARLCKALGMTTLGVDA
eukprot:COSAG04_NODE_10024_length_812_cov_1.164095_1_plen_215_part_01